MDLDSIATTITATATNENGSTNYSATISGTHFTTNPTNMGSDCRPRSNEICKYFIEIFSNYKFLKNLFFCSQTSQSLQLLFQLPNVQQTVAQQQPSTLLTTSAAPPNLCQTTVIQPKQNNLHAPNEASAINPAFTYGNNAVQFSVSLFLEYFVVNS